MSARERFATWVAELEASGLTKTEVAAMLGCSASQITRLINGERNCDSTKIAAAIERHSGGRIRAVDWHPVEIGHAPMLRRAAGGGES